MGMPVENYNIGDLEKYAKFKQDNPDLKVLETIRLYNLKRQENNKKFVENFMKLAKLATRRFKTWNFGDHTSLTFHGFEFGLGISYSYDASEQDASIVVLRIICFTFEICF